MLKKALKINFKIWYHIISKSPVIIQIRENLLFSQGKSPMNTLAHQQASGSPKKQWDHASNMISWSSIIQSARLRLQEKAVWISLSTKKTWYKVSVEINSNFLLKSEEGAGVLLCSSLHQDCGPWCIHLCTDCTTFGLLTLPYLQVGIWKQRAIC